MTFRPVWTPVVSAAALLVAIIATVIMLGGGRNAVLLTLGLSAVAVGLTVGAVTWRRRAVLSPWLTWAVVANPVLALVFAGAAMIANVAGLRRLEAATLYVTIAVQPLSLLLLIRHLTWKAKP